MKVDQEPGSEGSGLNVKWKGGRAIFLAVYTVGSKVPDRKSRGLFGEEIIPEVWLMGRSTGNKLGKLGSIRSGAHSTLICLLNEAKELFFPVTTSSCRAHVLGPIELPEEGLVGIPGTGHCSMTRFPPGTH